MSRRTVRLVVDVWVGGSEGELCLERVESMLQDFRYGEGSFALIGGIRREESV